MRRFTQWYRRLLMTNKKNTHKQFHLCQIAKQLITGRTNLDEFNVTKFGFGLKMPEYEVWETFIRVIESTHAVWTKYGQTRTRKRININRIITLKSTSNIFLHRVLLHEQHKTAIYRNMKGLWLVHSTSVYLCLENWNSLWN